MNHEETSFVKRAFRNYSIAKEREDFKGKTETDYKPQTKDYFREIVFKMGRVRIGYILSLEQYNLWKSMEFQEHFKGNVPKLKLSGMGI